MAMTFGAGVPKSGMMEIGIALVLHDRFSNQAGQASAAIKKLQTDARMAVQSNLQTASQFGMMGIGAFTAIAAGVRDMLEYGAQFVDTMTTVEAITEATAEQMTNMNEIALSLGKQTMFSSQDIASGMKYLAMAGNTAEQIQGMIKGATYAAGATGMELGGKGGAADVITNVMRTFQLEGERAALWVGDVMTNATLSANMSMNDLAASIRYAAADMTNLGYTLPEVSAAIGTLGNMGIQGSMAGTALANMARYLNRSISDPSYKGHKFLQQIGLDKEQLTNADGSLKSLYEIITMIKDASVNLDPSERNLLTTGIFGVRGNRAAMALMRDTEGFMRLYQDIMNTGEGYAQSVVEKRMGTIAGQLNVVKSTWENLKASFTVAMSGFFIPILKAVTKWLDGIRKILGTGIGRFIAKLGLVSSALVGLGGAIMVIRSRVMMLQTDSMISGRNMFAVLFGGWKGVNFQAAEYLNLLKAIKMQQAMGIGSKIGWAALAGGAVPGVGAGVDKQGRKFAYDKATGRRLPHTDPRISGALGAGAGAAATAVVGKNIAKATTIGGRLLSAGGKLFKLMGGWWGVAIMAITTIVPWLIGKISKNTESHSLQTGAVDENTLAVNGLTAQYQEQAAIDAANKADAKERELKIMVNLLGQLVRGQQNKEPVTVNIRMPDGSVQTFTDEEVDEMFDLGMK